MKEDLKTRFLKYINVKENGCWEWTAYKNANGYGCIGVDRKSCLSHRVAYAIFVGDIPNGVCVLHKCDNPGCVNPDHLFLGSRIDNIFDMIGKKRDRHLFGEQHGRSKLTGSDVVKIRKLLKSGFVSQEKIAKMFGITQCVISDINLGRIWRSV